MNYFYDLSLNEKLCASAILVEDWEKGFEFTYNGKKRIFKPKDVGIEEPFNISRVLYIMSNFIVNKNSHNITPNLRTLVNNENINQFLNYFEKNDFIKKLDIFIIVFNFLSNNETLKKLNFIDQIKPDYKFSNLANDIEKYKLSL